MDHQLSPEKLALLERARQARAARGAPAARRPTPEDSFVSFTPWIESLKPHAPV